MRERIVDELQRIAGGIGGVAPVARRRGRPPSSRTQASAQGPTAVVRRGPGRPPGSRNQAKPAGAPAPATAPARGRRRRKGLTTAVVDLLKSSGGAYTAGEIVAQLKLPKTTSQTASVSTTLVRRRKAGRVKRDKVRGYRAV